MSIVKQHIWLVTVIKKEKFGNHNRAKNAFFFFLVSRPCKRCVSLNKTDTCHDMQHKKRGRPKLREKRVYSPNENNYEILYGTIQTPAITIKPATTSSTRQIIPAAQQPIKLKNNKEFLKRTSVISFVHEPIESFQQATPPPSSIDSRSDSFIDSVPLSSSNNSLFFNEPPLPQDNIVTIILSMEVCCAKASDDIIKCWGYYPQELAHRSFYDFISPKDSDRMARLHRLLIDNALQTNTTNMSPLPPTERTTSSLFSTTEQSMLIMKANGSRSFSDTIHIKKRSGDYELYEVVVYIGGGLGADLYNPLTLSKQYIVAQFKKHEYEVTTTTLTDNPLLTLVDTKPVGDIPPDDFYYQSIAAFSPLTPTSPSNNLNNLLKSDFPTYEKVEKRLSSNKFSHISSSTPSISPKFNIAPITNTSNSSLKRFLPSISSSISLRPPTTATHPTQQYFLQTSSSTLNAAASAAQNKSRPSTSEQNVVTTGRKMEMSIRSLLC